MTATLLLAALLAAPLTVTLDPGRQFQTLENFGASGCWGGDHYGAEWTEEHRNRLADLLFSRETGIGLSAWRFNIGAGSLGRDKVWNAWNAAECFKATADAPYDWSKQAGQQWFLRAARARGVDQFIAFANSPPVWLTANGHAYCDKGAVNLPPANVGRFAVFLADVLQHFAEAGLPFNAVSPVNEPNWAWTGGQEGCHYRNADLRAVLLALRAELSRRKLTTAIEMCEAGSLQSLLDNEERRAYERCDRPASAAPAEVGEYIRLFLGDPELRACLGDTLVAHGYGADTRPPELDELRRRVRANLDRYAPGARYHMSEYCIMERRRDLGMEAALRLARCVHADLAVANATAWQWWLAVSPFDYKDGLIYTDYQSRKTQNIIPAKMLWALGNYSRFIRPGARRVGLTPDDDHDDLHASAYLNADGRLAVVWVNSGGAAKTVQLALAGRVAGWTPWLTDATHDLAAGEPLAADAPVTIPPRAVLTLVGAWQPGGAVAWPAETRAPREQGGEALYRVQCGGGLDRVTDARRNSLLDQPLGDDPRTGYRWGYRSWGASHGYGNGADTVRWEDGKAVGQGLTYEFAVPAGARLKVTLGWHDPWHNAGRAMTVEVAGAVREASLVPGEQPVERTYDGVVAADGRLAVSVRRAPAATAPEHDPLLSWLRVATAAP